MQPVDTCTRSCLQLPARLSSLGVTDTWRLWQAYGLSSEIALMAAELNGFLDEFISRGFVVVPAVLDHHQVAEARGLLAAHRAAHATRSWMSPPGEPGEDIGALYGPNAEAGRWQCSRLFEADCSLDPLVDALLTAEPLATLVRKIVGDDLCLRGVWSMWRMPVLEAPPPPEERAEGSAWPRESGIHYQMWHREEGGLCLPQHPFFVHSLQVKQANHTTGRTVHCHSLATPFHCDILML